MPESRESAVCRVSTILLRPMFAIVVSRREPFLTVLLEGRFDIEASLRFSEEMEPYLESEDFILLGMEGCSYLSSSGIRSLMILHRRLAAGGGGLLMAGVVQGVRQVLEISGLDNLFQLCGSVEEAEAMALERRDSLFSTVECGGFSFRFRWLCRQIPILREWRSPAMAGFDELGFSAGTGTAADSPDEEEIIPGSFFTLGHCAAFLPFDRSVAPDVRVVQDPAEGAVYLRQALSFGPEPAAMASLSGALEVGKLANGALQLSLETGMGETAALVIANHQPGHPSVMLLLCLDEAPLPEGEPEALPGGNSGPPATGRGVVAGGVCFRLDSLPLPAPGTSLREYLRAVLTLDNIREAGPASLSEAVERPGLWLFPAGDRVDAENCRIRVDTSHFPGMEPYQAFLARRLYHDSGRIVVRPLHGGYSAQTFQVDSFDTEGRKLRPTVMKMAHRALIAREAERCRLYALPYILNNSAMVLGTAFFGGMGALRYNFVGIGGEQSRLRWLTHCYEEWPSGKLIPLFDKIFTQILKPWYGQPVRMTVFPYGDHDPTATFFPRLCDTAREVLGIDPGNPFLDREETGEKLVNPYWFLDHEYPARRAVSFEYPTSVCHGDLNMQNILLDESLNVYLIDFSETRPRAVVSDFARMEAIFMVERAPVEGEKELREMTGFLSRWYREGEAGAFPAFAATGKKRDILEKNLALARRMRHYAGIYAPDEGNFQPYVLAMLEWVLPIVCYAGLPLYLKKLSAFVAGMLCGRLVQPGS